MVKRTGIIKQTIKAFLLIQCCFLQARSQTVSKQDTLFIEELLSKARADIDENPEQAVQEANRIIKFSETKQYYAGLANAYNILGPAYDRKSDYKKAILYYNLAKKVAEEKNLEQILASVLYNSASTYEHLSNYDDAFKATEQALIIKRKLNDSVGIARCYRQIGQNLSYKGDYALSISYFKKALSIQQKSTKKQSTAKTLSSMAVVYVDAKMYTEAIEALTDAKKIGEDLKDSLLLEHVYLNMGFCYDGMGKRDSAEHYYLKSLSTCNLMNIESEKVIVLNNLGELYLKENKPALAEINLTTALKSAEKINSIIDLKYIQHNLAELYSRMGDYKKAYYYKEQYIITSDSLMNEEKMRAVEEISTRFETKEVEEQNKLLQKENDLQKTKVEQKNYLIFGILLFAALIVIILILYNRQNKFKAQKQNLDIEQKLLQIQMNPHFIFNSLQAIQSFILTNRQKESAGYLTSFSRLMRLILENSKHEFISLDKEIDTLTYYLELQQLRFKDVFKYYITVDPAIDKEFTLVPPMLLQPFIENAIEHGFKEVKEKGLLRFNVSRIKEDLVLEIIDNGIGIERSVSTKPSGKGTHTSYALEIIKKRIEVINRKLKTTIELTITDLSGNAEHEHGTKISLYIPTIHKSK